LTERHRQVKELYLQAREVPPDERKAWLEAGCGGDTVLQAEVELLLAADQQMPADYLMPRWGSRLVAGSTFSRYRIVESLGTGGMGEVWLAEQTSPVRRRVALKVVRWGLDSDEALARFESECQALAVMVHPGIAQVYDAGTNPDGRPYFAMEYVPGIPITDYCDSHRLNLRGRLELFRQVCLAVQHAHQKGVIHRDLKPGNMLVAEVDGIPHAKIIDFGVAKATSRRLTEHTLHTELHRFIGTPAYMSPEQADATVMGVDTRSDIYSLGVTLYELLTGQLPFDATRLREVSYEEMLRILREEEPPRLDRRVSALGEQANTVAQARDTDPAALVHTLHGDLSWIVARALRKDPERRYASVAELLADIDRHLNNRPVEARPDSLTYRAGRFLSRHRLGATSAALLLTILVAYAITVTLQARALSLERDRVQAEAIKTQQVTAFMIDLFGTADPEYALGETFTARELLDQGAARVGKELAGQPELLAPLLTAVGEIYQRLGVYDEAESRLRQALAAARESGRAEDEAEVLHKLGRALVERHDTAAAEPLLRRAMVMRRRQLGENHPLVAETLESLSRLHFERGELEQAEALARQGLALLQIAEPEEGRRTALLLHRLGLVLLQRADYGGAEEALRGALEKRRQIHPEPHPEIATSLANLAYLLHTIGRYDEAERLYREAVESYRSVLGEGHPWVGRALAGLASTLRARGELQEAEKLHRQVLQVHIKNLGDSDDEVAMAFNDLGRVLQDQGRLDEAEAHYREALARYPEDHHWRPSTLRNLATVFEARGALEQAAAIHRDLLAQDIASLGEDHDRVALSQALLGSVLIRLGRAAEAEPLLRRAQAIFQAKLPGDHPRHSLALVPLGHLLCLRGDFAEGERLLTAGRQLRMQHYGAEDLRTAEADLALGSCLMASGRTGEARLHLANAYDVFHAGQDIRQSEAAAALTALADLEARPHRY
jgi:serine/threonine protein kinase/Tfp pilus assembly protein PilF